MYQKISDRLEITYRRVQYTCENEIATSRKHTGHSSQLSEEHMDEIIEFISASRINCQMLYKKLIIVLHLEINEKCLGRALKRRGYSHRIAL
ncbi:hypothetical protein I7I53_07583 [Histoplasma capsulatum var. duboisii H88]|uniref:Uncharacterized protein n=1 Tax=Ajellomyces capsulatus (strain H88) TaxID=544711 RepID=A0A8A1LCE5_AJEC8|nr:hypothetical protein I7I53_07583 [Histoplasma capsulatum var. duboisii H88]